MRELARRLGVKAASLYNHIAGKGDLLDGLANLALSGIDITLDAEDWRDAMRRRAISARKVFARHRWAAGLIDSRDRRGRERLAYTDRVLGVLIRAGFSTAAAANAFLVLDSYIYGFERQRPAASTWNETDGTEAARKILEAIPDGEYPFAARVAAEYAAAPFDVEAAFEFGLGLILDGLEHLLGR
jgi:AcrR family transcriptional regulator